MSTSIDPITTLPSITRELEAGWSLFDGIWSAFGPREWSRKFGKTWTYAEQPWHLAYFDGTLAKYLADGPNTPERDRLHLRSMGDLNEWNRREFARRSPGQPVEVSLAEMQRSRETVRRLVGEMTEADLERRTWMPLIFGWGKARDVLQAIIVHNVAEYWKLWLRTGQRAPAPSPAAVHLRLAFMMNFMPVSMNRELAKRKPFTMVMNFEGPGGGAWTFNVRNGECTVSESRPASADLTLTMKPETFHKMVAKMSPPPVLLLTRQIRVKGLRAMGTFARLFPEPRPDQVIEPGAMPAAG